MKLLKITLALLTISTATYANTTQAPTMRGELLTTHTPHSNIMATPVPNLPTPKAIALEVTQIPTILIASTTQGSPMLDVTLIDDFIEDVSPNARHYPPNFPNRTAQHNTKETIKYLSSWLEPYASAKNASFEVLLRASKINAMARNLDLGSSYGVKASTYMTQALKLQPNHAEMNFLYGNMLSEGGGFKEGKKYLDKAVSQGYIEAEQSLAQAELLNDNRTAALSRLQALQAKNPNNTQLSEQIRIINNGGFYIWDIKDNDVNVKPIN